MSPWKLVPGDDVEGPCRLGSSYEATMSRVHVASDARAKRHGWQSMSPRMLAQGDKVEHPCRQGCSLRTKL